MNKKIEYKFDSIVVESKNLLLKLFEDFDTIKIVSYVLSPDLIIDFLALNYNQIEIILGEDVSKSFKTLLSKKDYSYTIEVANLIKDNKVFIYVPNRIIHSKFFILENPKFTRVIQGSYNFTNTANLGKQINYVWYFDFYNKEHSYLQKFRKDYLEHRKYCRLFMADLLEILNDKSLSDKEKIKIWLGKDLNNENENSIFINDIVKTALGFINDEDIEESLISIKTDKSKPLTQKLKKYLQNFNLEEGNDTISFVRNRYLDHELQGIPIMRLNEDKGELVVGISGKIIKRTDNLPSAEHMKNSLKHIESYCDTINLGISRDYSLTKMNLFEGLLYIFASPFFNQIMIKKREAVGQVDLRGPRYLYLYGPSFNGKTTFFRFALKLISGYNINPIDGKKLDNNIILNLSNTGTSFPLLFDDIPSNKWNKNTNIEGILKNYWESLWNYNKIIPQIIMSSNEYTLRPWARSRIKPIIFDVHFSGDLESSKQLNKIFETKNDIYTWFTKIYISLLNTEEFSSQDELYIARKTMIKLYDYANLELPDYFPLKPIEEIFDYGKLHWKDLIETYRKAKIVKKGLNLFIQFDIDMTQQIQEYISILPRNIKFDKKGTLIHIENPKEFIKWYGDLNTGLFSKMLHLFFQKI